MKKRKKKQKHIVISGYYGYGSLGDETVLSSILSGIAETLPESTVTVLYAKKRAPAKINWLLARFIKRTDPLAVIAALISADLFISGGGSLMQDVTSKRSLSYYCGLIRLAKLCRCKIFVYANGIGPLKSTKKCSRTLLLCDMISVRDPDSFAFAKALTQNRAELLLSADPIFTYSFSKSQTLNGSDTVKLKKPYFAVSLRRCADGREIDNDTLIPAILKLKNQGLTPVFVPMQNSYDLELSKTIAEKTDGIVANINSCDELYDILKGASLAMGMRLHFLFTAAIAGTPLVALSYDKKVDSCIRSLGIYSIISAFDFTKEQLVSTAYGAMKSFSPEKVAQKCREMQVLSICDRTTVCELIEGTQAQDAKNAKSMEKFFADT